MAGNAAQVVAGRDIIVYTAPHASANDLPADTVVWGTSWPANGTWTDAGYTKEGLHFRMQVQRQNINVDQSVDPVLRIPTGRDLSMSTNLAQINATNFKSATGESSAVSTVAAGSGTRGHDDISVSGTITDTYISVGFDIKNPGDSEAIRLIGYKGLVQAEVALDFIVTDAAQLAFSVGLLVDTITGSARVAKFRDVLAAL